MSSEFHSPYQFIPVKKCRDENKTAYSSRADLHSEKNTVVRHDRWTQETVSGRIRVSFFTESPLVVGAKQKAGSEDSPAIICPYRQKKDNIRQRRLAIPANSLRGMIASLVETISQSSFRVLAKKEDSTYTVRQDVSKPLKQMGVLFKDEGKFFLFKLPEPMSIKNVYKDSKDKKGLFFNKDDADFIKKILTYQHKEHMLYTYAAQDTSHSVKNISTEKGGNQIKGVLYRRGKQIGSKINESFIPWDGRVITRQAIEVTRQVQALEKTLRLYQDKKQPENALPIGYRRDWKNEESELVAEGDLIYYKQEKGEITELSYSQIWRKPVKGNLYKALANEGDKDTLPWHQDRQQLTPAERLFGVVEEPRTDKEPARNLASRIQFTDAVSNQDVKLMPAVILKILDSPKPPSPTMYFHGEKAEFISKDCLDLDQHKPNGRKHYLPQPNASAQNWETENTLKNPPTNGWKQYLSCTPIVKDTEFTFDIHFENLSKAELGLLQTALQPSVESTFMHRLGLGKPLGLGQIKLNIEKTELINRIERYSLQGLGQARYQPYQQAIDRSLCDKETLNKLTTLYDPSKITKDVCYPYDQRNEGQQPYNEKEGFKWFTNNKNQMLKPIAHKKIPTLKA